MHAHIVGESIDQDNGRRKHNHPGLSKHKAGKSVSPIIRIATRSEDHHPELSSERLEESEEVCLDPPTYHQRAEPITLQLHMEKRYP